MILHLDFPLMRPYINPPGRYVIMEIKEYFGDLNVRAVYDKTFSYQQMKIPRVIQCKPGIYSIEMILDGCVKLQKDETVIPLKAPVVFWIGDAVKQFQYRSSGSFYRHLWIDFTGPRGCRIYHALRSKFPEGKVVLPRENLPAILNTFLEIKNDFHRKDGYNINTMTFNIEKLVYLILAVEDKHRRSLGDPHDINNLIDNLRMNPFEKYDTRQIAAEKGISEVYFRLLFRQFCGMSFFKFLSQTRLESSKNLILSGKYRIKEIAELCGYSGIGSFSNAFTANFGISPRAYRKQMNEDKI